MLTIKVRWSVGQTGNEVLLILTNRLNIACFQRSCITDECTINDQTQYHVARNIVPLLVIVPAVCIAGWRRGAEWSPTRNPAGTTNTRENPLTICRRRIPSGRPPTMGRNGSDGLPGRLLPPIRCLPRPVGSASSNANCTITSNYGWYRGGRCEFGPEGVLSQTRDWNNSSLYKRSHTFFIHSSLQKLYTAAVNVCETRPKSPLTDITPH